MMPTPCTRHQKPLPGASRLHRAGIVPLCLAITLSMTTSLEAGYRVYPGGKQYKRTVVLTPAGALVGPSTSTYADQRRNDYSGANTYSYYTLNYPTAVDRISTWQFAVPLSYGGTTATVTVLWMPCPASGTCSGVATSANVTWRVEMDGRAAGDTFEGGLQATADGTTASGATYGVVKSTSITPVTTGWAGGEVAIVKLTRRGSADAFNATAKLLAVKIEWMAVKESDE